MLISQSHAPKRPHYRCPTTCVDRPHCGHGHRVHARHVLFHPHDHRDPHDLCGHHDVRRHARHGARRRDRVHRGLRVRGRHGLHHGYGLYDHRDARRHDERHLHGHRVRLHKRSDAHLGPRQVR